MTDRGTDADGETEGIDGEIEIENMAE